MPKSLLSVLALGAAVLATGAASAEPLKVVASFSIIGDFAANVGGDRVKITTLVGPNGDAHTYEARPADAAAVGEADVVLVNGLGFEGFIPKLAEASGSKAPVVELTKGVTPIEAAEDEDHEGHDHSADAHKDHDHGAFDPHAFQSIPNAQIYVKNIAKAFCAADAAGCETYKANAMAYEAKLDKVDAEVREFIAAIPADKRTIITSHDAFGYFAFEYGVMFLAPEGISTEAEASASDVAKLITQVREEKASAVFVENITNTKLIQQIASETGLKVGGTLYSDALSDASGPASTYIDMMHHNVRTIRGAILGS